MSLSLFPAFGGLFFRHLAKFSPFSYLFHGIVNFKTGVYHKIVILSYQYRTIRKQPTDGNSARFRNPDRCSEKIYSPEYFFLRNYIVRNIFLRIMSRNPVLRQTEEIRQSTAEGDAQTSYPCCIRNQAVGRPSPPREHYKCCSQQRYKVERDAEDIPVLSEFLRVDKILLQNT